MTPELIDHFQNPRNVGELPPPAVMEEIAAPWRPHRSLACRYLWRSLDNEPG